MTSSIKSSRFKKPTATVMSPVLEYPEDLNPFGDDDIELDENKPAETEKNQYSPGMYFTYSRVFIKRQS